MNTFWQRVQKLKTTQIDKKAELATIGTAVLLVFSSRVMTGNSISLDTLSISILLVIICRIVWFILIE